MRIRSRREAAQPSSTRRRGRPPRWAGGRRRATQAAGPDARQAWRSVQPPRTARFAPRVTRPGCRLARGGGTASNGERLGGALASFGKDHGRVAEKVEREALSGPDRLLGCTWGGAEVVLLDDRGRRAWALRPASSARSTSGPPGGRSGGASLGRSRGSRHSQVPRSASSDSRARRSERLRPSSEEDAGCSARGAAGCLANDGADPPGKPLDPRELGEELRARLLRAQLEGEPRVLEGRRRSRAHIRVSFLAAWSNYSESRVPTSSPLKLS